MATNNFEGEFTGSALTNAELIKERLLMDKMTV